MQTLLVFLLFAENKLLIPSWLQPLGRLHPVVLHLPIGFFFSIIGLQFIRSKIDQINFVKVQSFLIYLTALFGSLVAVMGFFLAQENGYDDVAIKWHKWTGIIFSFLMYYMAWLTQRGHARPTHVSMLIVAGSLLLVTGHLGGEITHGKGFVFSPLKSEEPVSLKDSSIYAALIRPILESKCTSCHNEQKAKGELIMTTRSDLQRGGKPANFGFLGMMQKVCYSNVFNWISVIKSTCHQEERCNHLPRILNYYQSGLGWGPILTKNWLITMSRLHGLILVRLWTRDWLL